MTVTRLDQGQRYRPRMAFLKKVSSQPAWQCWGLRRARIKPCRDMRCRVVTCHVVTCHAISCHAVPCHPMPCHARGSALRWSRQGSPYPPHAQPPEHPAGLRLPGAFLGSRPHPRGRDLLRSHLEPCWHPPGLGLGGWGRAGQKSQGKRNLQF